MDSIKSAACLPVIPVHHCVCSCCPQHQWQEHLPGRSSAGLTPSLSLPSDRFLVQQDPAVQAAAAETITEELTWLLQMMNADGPLAVWPDKISLIDCAVAPFLMRLFILEHYR